MYGMGWGMCTVSAVGHGTQKGVSEPLKVKLEAAVSHPE